MTNRRSIVTLEAAIVFPVLILLTMGLLEYGWLFLKAQHITNAARQGARVGARVNSTSTDIQVAVDQAMNAGGLGGIASVVSISPADITLLEPGQMLSVTVQITYADIELGLPLTPTPATLQTTVVMAREGH